MILKIGLSSYIFQSGSQTGTVNQLNIRFSRKLLIMSGTNFRRGGSLHNKLFSFSGTKKYKSRKTTNSKPNCCDLELLMFVNIFHYDYLPNITLITFDGSKEPTGLLLLLSSITVSISLLFRIDSANVSIIASLATFGVVDLLES